MPEKIYVHYEGVTSSGIYPQGAFSHFDPYDFSEPDRYPSYVDVSDADDLAAGFNQDLADFMERNNIILTSDPADYELKVLYLAVGESLSRDSYFDSCANASRYVYYSELDATVEAKLYKNGFAVDSWERHASSSEEIRDKRGSCNEPKVRSIFRKPSSLFGQLARELRMTCSRRIYKEEFK